MKKERNQQGNRMDVARYTVLYLQIICEIRENKVLCVKEHVQKLLLSFFYAQHHCFIFEAIYFCYISETCFHPEVHDYQQCFCHAGDHSVLLRGEH